MSELSPTQGCSYTDGPQYVGCQVAEKGWPMPQGGGGKRSKSRKCSRCGSSNCRCKNCRCVCCRKRHHKISAKKSMRKKGGFLGKAIVPFGLLALQKRTQRRNGRKSSKKSRYARRSRKNRRSGRR